MVKFLRKLFLSKKLASIYGESSTGKTTMALQLIDFFLSPGETCIWIQASEEFPIKRFNVLSNNVNLSQIFISPKNNTCSSYEHFLLVLKSLFDEYSCLPPSVKFIVIDNISHHLRYKISQSSEVREVMAIQNDFYDNYLLRLIMMCEKEDISLILLHEITYNPNLDKNVPFYNRLYERLDSITISLEKPMGINHKIMNVKFGNRMWSFSYFLKNQGLIWSNYIKEESVTTEI